VLNISNIKLSLNPAAKECYLIPRWNGMSKMMECVLEPSYVGLVKLLTDAGSIKGMSCNLVYEGDTFSIDLATNVKPVVHSPSLSKSKRGNVIGAYALATFSDNSRQVEWMDIEDINVIRERSETYKAFVDGKIKSCTWVTDYGEMARKTVIKRIYKYLPRTEKMKIVDEAIKIDNTDYSASEKQLDLISSLLETSSYDEDQRDNIRHEMQFMSSQGASEMIERLYAHQLGIDGVTNPSAKDINNHVRKIAQS
jgi:recombination protein RecT